MNLPPQFIAVRGMRRCMGFGCVKEVMTFPYIKFRYDRARKAARTYSPLRPS